MSAPTTARFPEPLGNHGTDAEALEGRFLARLDWLEVPLFTSAPNSRFDPSSKDSQEFYVPTGWQNATTAMNREALANRAGKAIRGLMNNRVAVVDVDTKNGADVELVRSSLEDFGVRIHAEVVTPSGGRHFYTASTPDVPKVTAEAGRDGLSGLPGVEIMAGRSNVFLPGTRRPKYSGGGYGILFDRLDEIAEDDGSMFAAWVDEHRIRRDAPAPTAKGVAPTDSPGGAHPWVEAKLKAKVAEVAATQEGSRNNTLNSAALDLGHYVPHHLDRSRVEAELTAAAAACGLGAAETAATIRSGMGDGMRDPRTPPESKANTAVEVLRTLDDDEKGRQMVRTPGGQPGAEEAAQLLRARQVAEELGKLEIRHEARRLFDERRKADVAAFDAGTLNEVLARPAEPPMRVEELVPWEAGVLAVAQRKTGKTTLAANYSRALLTGEDFLDRFGVRKLTGDMAVLNFEVSGAQLARWFHEAGVPGDRCHLVNLRGRRNPLSHAEDRERLAAHLRARGVESVIVDPFGRAYTGTSQNDAGEVTSWLVDLDVFIRSEVGARDLLLTAHSGWDKERTRGSSALEDWADVYWNLTKGDGDDEARYFKAVGRDVDLDEDQLEFEPSTRQLTMTGSGGRKQAAAGRREAEAREAILDLLQRNPEGLSGNDLATYTGRKDASFTRARNALVAEGLVDQTTRPKRGGGKLYTLSASNLPNIPKHTKPVPSEPTEPPSLTGGSGSTPLTLKVPSTKNTLCRSCGEPLEDVDGLGTHPGCEVAR